MHYTDKSKGIDLYNDTSRGNGSLDQPSTPVVPTDVVGGGVLHLADYKVDAGEGFRPDVFLDALEEPMQSRADCFDVLRIEAENDARKILSDAWGFSGVVQKDSNSNLPRHLQRRVDRLESAKLNPFFFALITEARLEARGQIETDTRVNYTNIMKHADARGVNLSAATHMLSAIKNGDYDDEPKSLDIQAAERLEESEAILWQNVQAATNTWKGLKDFAIWIDSMEPMQKQQASSLLELLAVDVCDDQSPGNLKSLIDDIYQNEVVELTTDFVDTVFSTQDPQSVDVQSWAAIFTDDITDAKKLLIARVEIWPEPLKRLFDVYTNNEKHNLLASLKDTLKPHFFKHQQTPTIQRGLDGVITNVSQGKAVPGIVNKAKKPKGVRTNGRVTPKAAVSNPELKKTPDNQLMSLGIIGNKMIISGNDWDQDAEHDPDTIDKLAEEFALDYPHEKKLGDDIKRMLASIRERPFGDGTTALKDLYLSDGSRVRRLNPVFQSGLSTSTAIAKDTRVLYATRRSDSGNSVTGVIAILRHDEYDRWISDRS